MRATILRQYVAIFHRFVERSYGAVHVARLPRVAVDAVDEELFHLFALGGNNRRAAAHRLQIDLAECLADRRVDEVVGRGVGGGQLFALQEAHEMGPVGRKQRLKTLLVRSAAHDA